MIIMNTDKLIAEFEGYYEIAGTFYRGRGAATTKNWFRNPEYRTSLDWLKPVIDKFLATPIETFNYNSKAMSEFRNVRASLANMPISKSIADFYNELIVAITWYNENKPA
jgi:hypothetical protein